MRERPFIRAQDIHFLLGEIADLQALAFGDLAAQRLVHARDRFHHGRLALTVGTENADALTRQHRAVDAAHDDVLPAVFSFIAAGDFVEHQHRIGQIERLAEFKREVRSCQHRRQPFHPLQRLDPALRLLGLAGLGLEAVDELLKVLDAVLLLAKGRSLQDHALGTHLFESGVVAAIAHQLGVVQMQGDAGDRVEKFPVMADDDQRAFIALQPGFQPDQGVEVQVIGRLVKQHQIGRTHQRPRQLQAHAPAARKAVDWPVDLFALETQAHQQRLSARSGVKSAGIAEHCVGIGHRVAIFFGLGLVQRHSGCHQAVVAFQHIVGGRHFGLGHVLGDLADRPLARDFSLALVVLQAIRQHREQARLAGAVAPDQADFLARLQRDAGVVEDDFGATSQRDIAQRDHGLAAFFMDSWVTNNTCFSPADVSIQANSSCGNAASKNSCSLPISSSSTPCSVRCSDACASN